MAHLHLYPPPVAGAAETESLPPVSATRFLSFGWTTKLLPRSAERLVVNPEFSTDCSSILGIKNAAVAWPKRRGAVSRSKS